MNINKNVTLVAGALMLGMIISVSFVLSDRRNEATNAAKEIAQLQSELKVYRSKLFESEKRARAADADNALMINLLSQAKLTHIGSGSNPEPTPVTVESLRAEIEEARRFAANRMHDAALRALTDVFRRGSSVPIFAGLRLTTVLHEMARLGEDYPPAIEALVAIREKAKAELLADSSNWKAASEFAAASRYLKEEELAIQMLEQLPEGDVRRKRIASVMFDALVERRRFAEALEGREFSSILMQFDASVNGLRIVAERDPSAVPAARERAVQNAVRNFEVLTSAGSQSQALILAEKLVAFDGSAETRRRLQEVATRVGKPELIVKLAGLP